MEKKYDFKNAMKVDNLQEATHLRFSFHHAEVIHKDGEHFLKPHNGSLLKLPYSAYTAFITGLGGRLYDTSPLPGKEGSVVSLGGRLFYMRTIGGGWVSTLSIKADDCLDHVPVISTSSLRDHSKDLGLPIEVVVDRGGVRDHLNVDERREVSSVGEATWVEFSGKLARILPYKRACAVVTVERGVIHHIDPDNIRFLQFYKVPEVVNLPTALGAVVEIGPRRFVLANPVDNNGYNWFTKLPGDCSDIWYGFSCMERRARRYGYKVISEGVGDE